MKKNKEQQAFLARKMWPPLLSLLLVLVFIPFIVSCQKAGDSDTKQTQKGKGENQEYLIDSLRAADRLEALGNQVINLFGKPDGIDTTIREPIYEEYTIKTYKDRLELLNFKENIDELHKFIEKYKDKPPGKNYLYSYSEINNIIQTMEFIDEGKSKVAKQNPYEENSKVIDTVDRSSLGFQLARFLYKTSSLLSHKEDYWLTPLQDVIKNLHETIEKAKKEGHLAEKERARALEEKLKGKK